MKYSVREDRDIRRIIKQTPRYESRASIQRRAKVNQIVENFGNNLEGFGEDEKGNTFLLLLLTIGLLWFGKR